MDGEETLTQNNDSIRWTIFFSMNGHSTLGKLNECKTVDVKHVEWSSHENYNNEPLMQPLFLGALFVYIYDRFEINRLNVA